MVCLLDQLSGSLHQSSTTCLHIPHSKNPLLMMVRIHPRVPPCLFHHLHRHLLSLHFQPQQWGQRGGRGQYPMYFTFRIIDGAWLEKQAICNIESALVFQLELSRLSNYKLTPVFVETKQIHMYHAVACENQLDSRFFIRALVCPGCICGTMSMAEYLESETDRLVTSILDTLEVVNAQHRNADCNHIFMNFVYNLAVMF